MVYWPPTHGILTTIHGIYIPQPWYFDPLSMVFWLLIHGISTPYLWYVDPFPRYVDPPTRGILSPYPWFVDAPSPMVYQTLSYGIMNPSYLAEMREVNLPWGGSKYNDKKCIPGSKYHMKIDPGLNILWGSKYHMKTVIKNKYMTF